MELFLCASELLDHDFFVFTLPHRSFVSSLHHFLTVLLVSYEISLQLSIIVLLALLLKFCLLRLLFTCILQDLMGLLPLGDLSLRLTLMFISLTIHDALLQYLIINFIHFGNSFLFLSLVVVDGLLLSL